MSRGSYALILAVIFSGALVFADGLVNINTADSTTLQTLSGIGPSKAQAIITYRTEHGPFQKIEDIMKVSGIGTATYNNIKDSITVGDAAQAGTNGSADQTQSQTQDQTQASSTTSTTPPAAPVPSYVPPPAPEIFADGGDDRTVIVGADTEFIGRAYNRDKKVLDHVRFLWNFGDGTLSDGPAVMHHYAYPGRYAAVLTIAEDKYSVSDHFVVTAELAQLSFSYNGDGSITITNRSGRNLDLSGWIIRSFGRTFTLPPESTILAGTPLRISSATLNFFAAGESELDYPNGVLAYTAASPGSSSAPAAASVTQTIASEPVAQAPRPAVVRIEESTADAAEMASSTPEDSPLVAAAAESWPKQNYWWLGAVGLALLAGGGILAARRFKKEEWDIAEG